MRLASVLAQPDSRYQVFAAEAADSSRLCRSLGLVPQPQPVARAAIYLDGSRSRPTELVALDIELTGACFPCRDGRPLFVPGVHPGYLRDLLDTSPGLAEQRRLAALPGVEKLLGSAAGEELFVFYHPNCNNFGHFLIECLPKLLTVKQVVGSSEPPRLVVPADAPAFVERFLAALLPGWPLLKLEHGCRYRGRFVSATLDPMYKYHPELVAAFHSESANAARQWGASEPGDEMIFVSRSAVGPSYRRLVNAEAIEAIARSRGLSMVWPERLTPAQQMACFAGARLIVGEYGSGLHNALYRKGGAVVVALNWINLVQQAIGAVCDQVVEFIPPQGGALVLDHQASSEAGYQIEETVFETVLDAAIEHAKGLGQSIAAL